MAHVLAALQMNSGSDVAANLKVVDRLVAEAAAAGSELVCLPENFACMPETGQLSQLAEIDLNGPIQEHLAALAAQHKIYIVAGSLPLYADSSLNKPFAACCVYGPDGARLARYNKLHLFDIAVPGGQESYLESASYMAGDEVICVDLPWATLGLSICYDLRFPELYRQLASQGATIIVAPAAFTYTTGQSHWDTLVRARAIENQLYIVAPNQCGQHAQQRRTWGHSMIVSPWGQLLTQGGDSPAVLTASYNEQTLQQIRRDFPALDHRRL